MRNFLKTTICIFSLLATGTAIAAPGQFVTQWANVRSTGVLHPLDNWQDVASIAADPNGAPDIRMLQGELWITLNRSEIGMLGLSSENMSNVLRQFAGPTVQVLAHYSQDIAELRIHMVRVERRPDGRVYVSVGDFTPHHGEFYRAYRHFLTPGERAAGRAGYNPFSSFRGDPTDPVFHRIAPDAALVAIGHAMRLNRAPTAWLASSAVRTEVKQKKSGNIFRKKVKTTVNGYAKPQWSFIGPAEMLPEGGDGTLAKICVDPGLIAIRPSDGKPTCDAPEHFAFAGIVASQWSGGNLPEGEDLIYHWSKTERSWTVLAYALFTWPIGGIFSAGAYGLANTVFHSGGSLTQAQDGFGGATGDGILNVLPADSDQVQGIRDGLKAHHVDPSFDAGLTATQQFYRGACPASSTSAQCAAAGLDPGMMFRPDSYSEANSTIELRNRYKACLQAGFAGDALQQCAAPQRTGVFSAPRN